MPKRQRLVQGKLHVIEIENNEISRVHSLSKNGISIAFISRQCMIRHESCYFQVVKATSRPHTNGTIVFARWRQCAPPLSTRQPACVSYRCCSLLSRFEYIDRRTCPDMSGPAPFCSQICPSRVEI